ncbi:uncharacterized protein LOC109706486 [Ananas comosus]|uniref:Uncharacterized protein LOC109706486 n=1 Tax=Ananas comosus TaxID=4615 RepID=A0A6P5EHI9_ANACO|nr:uncharacterized protein LOC109706486 [Ananas comosus]
MSTLEHLFMQIFERKNWIEGQLRLQIESYGESLGYNLLADGVRPPEWLWTVGFDAPHRADHKEIYGAQITSDFLFPPTLVNTPANQRARFTLPTLKETNLSQSSFFTETCVNIGGTLPLAQHGKTSGQQDKAESDIAEAYAEFSTFSRIHRSRSRQRDLENRLNEKSEATVVDRKDTINTGIVTRSRASIRSERAKESTVVKSVVDTVTDCRNSQSRHLDPKHSHDNLSKPDEPSEDMEGARRTSETQLISCLATSVKEDNLAIHCNDEAVVSSGCTAGTVSEVPTIDHFELKIGDAVASTLPEADLSVEPKKLLFDGIELCVQVEKPFSALETENQVECAESEHLKQCDFNGISLACFEEERKGRDSVFFVREENALVAKDELLQQEPERAGVSSANGHICGKDDVWYTSHVNKVLTDGQKEMLKLLRTREPEDNSQTTMYNSMPSNLPVAESLELISRNDTSMTSFVASPGQCTIKLDKKDKELKGTSDDLFQHTDISNSDGLVSPLTEKVETFRNKDDVATPLEFGKSSITQLSKIKQTPENCCLSDYMELTVDDTPNTSDKVSKTQNHDTNSHSLDRNLGSCGKNDYISPYPDEFSMHPGVTKDEIHQELNVVAEKSVISFTAALNDREISGSSPAAQCCLRSPGGNEKNTPFDLKGKNISGNSKRPSKTQLHANGVSWPKRRKMNCHSNNFLATPPRAKVQPVLNSQGDSKDLLMNQENDSGASLTFRPLSLANEMESNRADVAADGCFDVLSQSSKISLSKMEPKQLLSPVSYLDDGVPSPFSELAARTIQSTPSKPAENCNSEEDGHDLLCSQNMSKHEISRRSSLNVEINDKEVRDNYDNLDASNIAKPSQYSDDSVECDGTMPEFEGFSIDVPSSVEDDILLNSSEVESLKEERASLLEHLYCSCPSARYKINKFPDLYQSSTTGVLELMRTTNSLESENREFPGLYENIGLEFDDTSAGRSHSQSIPSLSARLGQETSKPPLTPLVEKFSERKLSGRSGASSETVGSKPELTCFRIDEDISTADENDGQDGIYTSEERDCLEGAKAASNRKALQDVTATYQNVAPSKLEAYAGKKVGQQHMSLGNACPSKMKSKENRIHSVDGDRVSKVAELICSRSSKAEIAGEANERKRSQANLQKGCKPTNIVSNISSFIPLVKQKQQAPAVKGKKDIRVKALEAAEAAKRLEQKKQNEREMRKEAAKVERIRLKQEKELKLKQEEDQRKKKEADIAARKRQREEEERLKQEKELKLKQEEDQRKKKEADNAARKRQREEEEKKKEKKRKCIEEARKLQKEKEERINVEKEEKDARRKASDEQEQKKKGLVHDTKGQLKPDKEEVVVGCKDEELSTSVAGARTHDSNVLEAQQTLKNAVEQSYEMSPYRDSDDEDDDDGDEEIRRRRKYYPSWARRECLEQILLSKQHIDPREIFSRKSSFNLSEVLSPHIPRRQL